MPCRELVAVARQRLPLARLDGSEPFCREFLSPALLGGRLRVPLDELDPSPVQSDLREPSYRPEPGSEVAH
jgi:hypothetical protein